MMRRIKHHLRTYFLTGLLVVVPVGITLYVLKIVIGWADSLVALLPPRLHPNSYLPFPIPGLGLIITALFIMSVGIVTTNFIGKRMVALGEQIVDKIPLVRSIYVAVKQLLETIFSRDKESFKRVVMVEYPRKGIHSIGFVTGVSKGEIQDKTGQKVLNVFVPTAPNPTSGYLIMVPEDDTIPLDMDVETAFKMVLSGGMITSENQTGKNDE